MVGMPWADGINRGENAEKYIMPGLCRGIQGLKFSRLEEDLFAPYIKERRNHTLGTKGREEGRKQIEGRCHPHKYVRNEFQEAGQGFKKPGQGTIDKMWSGIQLCVCILKLYLDLYAKTDV